MIWWTGLAPWEFDIPFPGGCGAQRGVPGRVRVAERDESAVRVSPLNPQPSTLNPQPSTLAPMNQLFGCRPAASSSSPVSVYSSS